ncbi:MAG TPA: nitrate/nitrite transporter NrtS [Terriglobia bacterium]|nr:nitrate/nitrite transporter NrtS [Terriglobia bacterium]
MSAIAAPPRPEAPTWTKWYEVFRVIAYRPYLKKTVQIALIVGAVLFAINHLDEVVQGRATRTVWIKGAVTFLVPFCVSNLGVLVASRRKEGG